MGAEHLYPRQLTCLLFTFVLTLRVDPVFGQNGGVNWGAVGISWALSTVTTCLIVAAAFGIHGCLKSRKNGTTDDEGSGHENGLRNQEPVTRDQQRYVPSLDKPTSGLLSVSQQSAYLRAQDDPRTNNKKRKSRTSRHEPHVYVEQWCEDQAKRPSVVAALQGATVDTAQNVNLGEDNRSPYPAGLDLPNADVRSKPRNERGNRSLPNSRPTPREIQEESEFLLKSKRQKVDQDKRGAAQKGQNEAQNTGQSQFPGQQLLESAMLETAERADIREKLRPENTKTAPVSASSPKNLAPKADEIGELKSSPVRIRKHAQKQTGLPPKTNVLEFKRAPGESNHVLASRISKADRDNPVPKQPQQSDRQTTQQSSNNSSSSEEEEDDEEEDDEEDDDEEEEDDEEETSVSSEKPRASPKPVAALAVQKKTSRELFPRSDQHLESHTNSVVESTPPNPSRSEAVRRAPRQSKPPVLNAIPIPAEGISPPPGLLPLTASSHRQVTRGQRQMAVSQSSKEKIARDETTMATRRQTSPKRENAKDLPPSVDVKKRSSTGSDFLFFAPELQGTSTPAMRPKSAFVPFSSSMLSQDSADDNQDKLLTDVNIGLSNVANRSQTTPVSRNHQFHGLLSNTGLRHLAHAVHNDWRHLARNLHIPSDRQAFLVEKYSDSADECAFEMLKSWRDRHLESRSNLRSLLCTALVAANHPEMAERLIQEEMIGSSEKLDGVKLVSVV